MFRAAIATVMKKLDCSPRGANPAALRVYKSSYRPHFCPSVVLYALYTTHDVDSHPQLPAYKFHRSLTVHHQPTRARGDG